MWAIAVLNYHILFFLLVSCLSAQSWNPVQYNWNPQSAVLAAQPLRHLQRNVIPENLQRLQHFPICEKAFHIFKIWGEVGLAENHKTVAIFLPLPFPAPPGAINKSREMCKAHLQHDSPKWPEFWADKDINSSKWKVLLICMQLQCRDQGKFKAIHCC